MHLGRVGSLLVCTFTLNAVSNLELGKMNAAAIQETYTQYGTIRTSANGHSRRIITNGCVKCKMEQMARWWSQDDLTVTNEGMVLKEINYGWALAKNGMLVQRSNFSPHPDFSPDRKPCSGKYYLLRHGNSFYLLQFPCCRTR